MTTMCETMGTNFTDMGQFGIFSRYLEYTRTIRDYLEQFGAVLLRLKLINTIWYKLKHLSKTGIIWKHLREFETIGDDLERMFWNYLDIYF